MSETAVAAITILLLVIAILLVSSIFVIREEISRNRQATEAMLDLLREANAEAAEAIVKKQEAAEARMRERRRALRMDQPQRTAEAMNKQPADSNNQTPPKTKSKPTSDEIKDMWDMV